MTSEEIKDYVYIKFSRGTFFYSLGLEYYGGAVDAESTFVLPIKINFITKRASGFTWMDYPNTKYYSVLSHIDFCRFIDRKDLRLSNR